MLQRTARQLPWSCTFQQLRHKTKKVMCELIQDVPHVGTKGDIVELKFGFAYNYLVPTKRAKLVAQGTVPTKAVQSAEASEEEQFAKRVRQLDATLFSVLTTTVKIKAAVADAGSGMLKEPITLQHVLEGVRKQTGVVLHEAYLVVPHGRSADRLFDKVGSYDLPVNILFANKNEAVLEVQVTARPSKAKGVKATASVDESANAEEEAAS